MAPSARNNKHCSSACVNCSNRKKRCSGTGPTCASCAARGLQCDWKADRRRVQTKNAGADGLGRGAQASPIHIAASPPLVGWITQTQPPAFALPCAHIGPAPAFCSNAGDQFLHPNEAQATVANLRPNTLLVHEDIPSASNFIWVEPPRWSGAVCTPVNAFGPAIPPLFTGSTVLRG
ncbi:hypothetical protein AURDEDRAFT_175814 [Auricularia subglabra TFB-10046 SS5]|uniref:Zn(2)-C6 fungal-type domain-containing protein n=1 Tax=Auricularia subglabra (strain TFB-10046 / SS5) TaxID=717982 RepID=J0CWR9_AURST|nr:hypothetical protein AURDEDRAFT_175814 [Auricularia subglabra TFB-10046 SS5]